MSSVEERSAVRPPLRARVGAPVANVVTAVLVAAAIFALVSRLPLPLPSMGVALLAVVLAVALARAGRRALPVSAYLIAYLVFVQLRRAADETGIGVKADYVVDADRALAGGTLPTAWLQEHVAGAVTWPLVAVYLTYFVVPHVLAFVLWRMDRTAFLRYAVALLVATYVGLATSFLLPTAPPWLAAKQGDLAGVARILHDTLQPGQELAASNPVAAMPSLHMAGALVVALALARLGGAWRGVAVAYPLAMGLSLVFLGEHYVVDVLAGAAVAGAAWALACRWWAPEERPAAESVPLWAGELAPVRSGSR